MCLIFSLIFLITKRNINISVSEFKVPVIKERQKREALYYRQEK